MIMMYIIGGALLVGYFKDTVYDSYSRSGVPDISCNW